MVIVISKMMMIPINNKTIINNSNNNWDGIRTTLIILSLPLKTCFSAVYDYNVKVWIRFFLPIEIAHLLNFTIIIVINNENNDERKSFVTTYIICHGRDFKRFRSESSNLFAFELLFYLFLFHNIDFFWFVSCCRERLK